MKLNTLKLALAGGIIGGTCFAWATVASILNVPGFAPSTELLLASYGPWGYSISYPGALVGALWGFLEGFIWIGAFGLIYSRLAKS